jgi:hypothetical protein
MERLFFGPEYPQQGECAMAKPREKTVTRRIFDNILFLEEVFGDRADAELPKVPVLELARCFDQPHPRSEKNSGRRQREWALWK